MARATVGLELRCNNGCIFCAQGELASAAGDVEDQLVEARQRADAVTFIGGEPTLDARLESLITRARALGFARVGVQTNGRLLAGAGAAQRLASLGLTDAHLSLHGARAEVHDYHVGVAGAFGESVAGLAAAVAAGLTVVVATVLTRSNARVLGELPWFLRSRNVDGWLIEVPRTAGRLASAFDRIYPRLGIAVPFALHALQAAERVGLPAWIRGAPRCLVGPFVARALADSPRAFGKACAGCAERASCCGVDPIYLARFDGDELRPADATAATSRRDALCELFVGVGPYEPASLAPPAAAARRSLPLLGKVQPAVAEVPASTPRRSGEALKEIFPDLFAKPGQGG